MALFSFPRAGVGMQSRRDCKAVRENGTPARSELVPTPARGNQWEPENRTPARSESVPTPARGNQKTGRRRVPNRFPRRRVGTRKLDTGAFRIGSHAGAWEPEKSTYL